MLEDTMMTMVMMMRKSTAMDATHISKTAFSCSSLDFFSSISQSLCWSSSSSRSRAMSSTSWEEGQGAGSAQTVAAEHQLCKSTHLQLFGLLQLQLPGLVAAIFLKQLEKTADSTQL